MLKSGRFGHARDALHEKRQKRQEWQWRRAAENARLPAKSGIIRQQLAPPHPAAPHPAVRVPHATGVGGPDGAMLYFKLVG